MEYKKGIENGFTALIQFNYGKIEIAGEQSEIYLSSESANQK